MGLKFVPFPVLTLPTLAVKAFCVLIFVKKQKKGFILFCFFLKIKIGGEGKLENGKAVMKIPATSATTFVCCGAVGASDNHTPYFQGCQQSLNTEVL